MCYKSARARGACASVRSATKSTKALDLIVVRDICVAVLHQFHRPFVYSLDGVPIVDDLAKREGGNHHDRMQVKVMYQFLLRHVDPVEQLL